MSASNTSGAAQKISFFGANRQDSGEEAVSIKGKMVSNMGGSGNTQKGELAISTTGVERMVIDEDGVTTFTGNVQVGGDANAGSANGTKILSNSGIQASNDNTSAPLWRGYTTNNSTPTSSIKTSGSATFGQASNTTNNNGVLIGGNNGSFNIYTTRYSSDCFQILNTTGSGANVAVRFDGDGSATFAGQINGTTVGTSDQRFKENIAPAGSQLDDIAALGGILKNFDWNADAPVNDEIRATRQLGLIAQEAEVISPSLVKTVSRTTTNDEGEEVDDSYKGISHDALVMKLLGAVAELSAKVAALEAAN